MQQLDPLVYFRLKARMLELTVQEHQIIAARQRTMTDAGLMPGQYIFDDNTTSVMRVEDMPAAVPVAPAAAAPADAPADVPETEKS